MTTVAKIREPPTNVCIVGISFKKKNANMIPKTGCVLPMMLAVLALKYLRLFTNSVWPIAVVNNANKMT